jgi:hypothetical protein
MLQQTNPAIITVIEDTTQQNIIQNRRKLREQSLRHIGQQTSLAEQNIKELAKLTK